MRVAVFLGLAGVVGCGGPDPAAAKALDVGGPDANQVAALVEEVNESRGVGKRFADSFAKAVPAAEAKRYGPFAYYLVGRPTVAGSEATATVSVQQERDGTEVGQVDWQFVKDGDKWKIKSAPLPDARK